MEEFSSFLEAQYLAAGMMGLSVKVHLVSFINVRRRILAVEAEAASHYSPISISLWLWQSLS